MSFLLSTICSNEKLMKADRENNKKRKGRDDARLFPLLSPSKFLPCSLFVASFTALLFLVTCQILSFAYSPLLIPRLHKLTWRG
mmetsp:Transcript_52835/g.103319  ORF Transcript_52835/g.103319 Transcript_52835/m.103319 type:complete len:84 (-) Transcript_52835:550-801(-)